MSINRCKIGSSIHKKQTCCKSTSPEVAGLMILDNFGGQFIIDPFKSDECLKPMKTGRDESMAFTIGAS
jgi:hypothetical protein